MSTKPIGRLAMRHEGLMWNAYYALPGTMDDAILLGSIAIRFVPAGSQRYAAFMSMMQDSVSDIIEEQTGQRPTWKGPEPAPPREGAGHA